MILTWTKVRPPCFPFTFPAYIGLVYALRQVGYIPVRVNAGGNQPWPKQCLRPRRLTTQTYLLAGKGSYLWVYICEIIFHQNRRCESSLLICSTENNPEVMNALVHKLGLSKTLSFHDVFSIDDPDLLAFVPRPANALLLVFPVSKTYEKYRMEEDAHRPLYEGKGVQEPVIWYRQTIGNACGLMGLLHAVSNGPAKDFIGNVSV